MASLFVSMRTYIKNLAVMAGFFAFWSSAQAALVPQQDCTPGHIDQRVKVAVVYDGSSFLVDNRYVQLTGVHVPTYGRHLEPDQPLGKAIAQAVGTLVKRSHGYLNLEYDQMPSYKGKVLVHAYLEDGRNLALTLLSHGFAVVDTQLPNTRYAQCYRQAEAQARRAKKGLWKYQDQDVPVIDSSHLTGDKAGFQIVRGKILRVEVNESNVIMMMDTVVIRIDRAALALFDVAQLRALEGQVIEVRDDFTFYKDHMVASLEHPGQIDRLADSFYAQQLTTTPITHP